MRRLRRSPLRSVRRSPRAPGRSRHRAERKGVQGRTRHLLLEFGLESPVCAPRTGLSSPKLLALMLVTVPTTRKGRATRDRIVDAACDLVFDRGVAGLNLDEVREATG